MMIGFQKRKKDKKRKEKKEREWGSLFLDFLFFASARYDGNEIVKEKQPKKEENESVCKSQTDPRRVSASVCVCLCPCFVFQIELDCILLYHFKRDILCPM